jgi:uncharacterized membrane protein (UPF0127 family)
MLRVSFALASALAVAACTKSPRPSGDGDPAKTKTSAMEPSPNTPAPSDKRATVRFTGAKGEAVVSAEVVATPATIERGLMYRAHMPPDDGMLFLMGEEKQHVFWMHNTLIPLDMIFIGQDMKVAGIVQNATPQTDDRRSVDAESLFVLEVNGGWSAAHGVAAGAAVRFDGVDAAAH